MAGAVSLAVPEVGSLPDQPEDVPAPEAVQVLAPVLDQLRVNVPPGAIEAGELPSVTVGMAAPPLEEPLPEELPDEELELPLEELEEPPEELELLLEELELLEGPPEELELLEELEELLDEPELPEELLELLLEPPPPEELDEPELLLSL